MKVHAKIARVRGWLKWLLDKHPQRCVICGELIKGEAFLIGDADDGILVHHVDENRANNSPENLHVVHRSCHQRHHRLGGVLQGVA